MPKKREHWHTGLTIISLAGSWHFQTHINEHRRFFIAEVEFS